MDPTENLRQAEQLLKSGQRDEARRLIDAVLQADPHSYEAIYWRGVHQKLGGDLETAENDFRTVVGRLPNHDRAHYGLGLILESRGDLKGAVEAYKRTLGANPAHQPAREKLRQHGVQAVTRPQESPAPAKVGGQYSKLESLLQAGDWREADQETTRIMYRAIGRRELRAKDVEKLSRDTLHPIDRLWVQYSEGRFGFSIQRKLYQSQGGLAGPQGYDPTTFDWFIKRVAWHTSKRIAYGRMGNALLGSVSLHYALSAPPGHLPAAWVLPRQSTFFPQGRHGLISSLGTLVATLLYGAAGVIVFGVIGGLLSQQAAGAAIGAILGVIVALQIPLRAHRHAEEGRRTVQAEQNLMTLFSRMQACSL